MIDSKFAEITREDRDLFAEVKEKSILGFPNDRQFFDQKEGFKHIPISQRFYTYKKINSIFYKFIHSLLRMAILI